MHNLWQMWCCNIIIAFSMLSFKMHIIPMLKKELLLLKEAEKEWGSLRICPTIELLLETDQKWSRWAAACW